MSYYVIAHASRSILGSREKYFWMVETRVDEQSKELTLSNSNLTTALPNSLDVVANAPIDMARLAEALEGCE